MDDGSFPSIVLSNEGGRRENLVSTIVFCLQSRSSWRECTTNPMQISVGFLIFMWPHENKEEDTPT